MKTLNKNVIVELIKEALEEQAGGKIYLATAFLANKPMIVGFSSTQEGAQKIAEEVVKASGNLNPLRIPSAFAVPMEQKIDLEKDVFYHMSRAAKKVKE